MWISMGTGVLELPPELEPKDGPWAEAALAAAAIDGIAGMWMAEAAAAEAAVPSEYAASTTAPRWDSIPRTMPWPIGAPTWSAKTVDGEWAPMADLALATALMAIDAAKLSSDFCSLVMPDSMPVTA